MLSDDRHIINEETMADNLSLVDFVGLVFAIVLLSSALAIIFWFWFLYRMTGNNQYNSQQEDLQVLNHQCEEVIQLIEM